MARGTVSRSYLWRLHALSWLWWRAVVKADAVPRNPSLEAIEQSRRALHRFLDILVAGVDIGEAVSRKTTDRWFGPSRPRREIRADGGLEKRLSGMVEHAIRGGLESDKAERVDARLRSVGKVAGAVTEAHPAWPSVLAALVALREPSTVEVLLSLEPALPSLLDALFDADARETEPIDAISPDSAAVRYADWDDAWVCIRGQILRAPRTVVVRVLGLTLHRVWDNLTLSLLPKLKAENDVVPLRVELLQLSPTAPLTAALNPEWPSIITQTRSRISTASQSGRTAGMQVILREYSIDVGLTGVAVGDTFVGTFNGFVRPAQPSQFSYFRVGAKDGGAAAVLHAHCESAWAAAVENSAGVGEF